MFKRRRWKRYGICQIKGPFWRDKSVTWAAGFQPDERRFGLTGHDPDGNVPPKTAQTQTEKTSVLCDWTARRSDLKPGNLKSKVNHWHKHPCVIKGDVWLHSSLSGEKQWNNSTRAKENTQKKRFQVFLNVFSGVSLRGVGRTRTQRIQTDFDAWTSTSGL